MAKPIVSIMLLFQLILFLSACVSTKNSVYLNNATDSSYLQIPIETENVIQNNDIISIAITSLNPDASALFNITNNLVISSTSSVGNNSQSSGYLVNSEGFVQLPILGNIQAAGLSKNQLKNNITQMVLDKKLLIDPIVNIRHLNFEVTVIGEVGHPTVINVPNEKISLLKALGLAGDITIYGKKDNVLVIRETKGSKKVKHVDLNSKNFLSSPYYYLLPNDVVYVEPNKDKVASVGRGRQLLPAILSGLSVIVIVLDRIIK
jgi:polysaccharide export outer membrane protein